MVYFLSILVLALFISFFVYIKKTNKRLKELETSLGGTKLSELEEVCSGFVKTTKQMLQLYDSVVSGQKLQAKAFELLSKQSHELAKDFYALRDQTSDGFSLIADLMSGKTSPMEELPTEEDKEKKSN